MSEKKQETKAKRNEAIKRGKAKGGSKQPCANCPALCCHDLAVPIDRPRLKADIDDLKWQLRYDNVHAAIRNRRWYMVINGRCIYLDDHDLCTVYDSRPETCRDHNPPQCERFGRWYQYWLDSPEQLDAYLGGKRRGLNRSSQHCSRGRLLGHGRKKRKK
jgi:uncharacterized protein